MSVGGSNPFLYGCTAGEIARLFEMPLQTVRDNLVQVKPTGKRGNADIWAIKDAAKALVVYNEEDAETVSRILRLNHTALPKMLSKEYWAGQTARQKFLREDGQLWPTPEVVQWLGDAYKTLRLSLMLLPESVDRVEALSEKQRDTIVRLVDETLNEMANRLVRDAENKRDASSYEAPPSGQDDGGEEL